MKRVLVTGANGFLGKALIKYLLKKKLTVYAIARSIDNLLGIADNNLIVIACTMENITDLEYQILEKIDICYHLAWEGTSGQLRTNYNIQMKNVINSCILVETCKKLGCDKFIFASTIMIYEYKKTLQCGYVPGDSAFYSIAKMTAENMLQILCHKLKISYTAALISNIYGPEEHSPRLVNTVINNLIQDKEVSLTAGTQLYDFIYINDAAEALYYVGKSTFNQTEYYIGNAQPKPLRNYINLIGKELNREYLLKFGEIPFNADNSLEYTEFDIFRLYKDTNFKKKTEFEEGIRHTIKFIKYEK